MTDKELEEFIHLGETGFVAVAMMFGEGWAQRAIDIAKELRARLAQGEQKSQAWMLITESGVCGGIFRFRYDAEVQARELGSRFSIVPLYAAPTQREWVGLTDEEIRNEANHHVFDESFFSGAVWARGKIKEKNNG
jgi:hypothetical protein